jgi:hypothetical protein
MSYVLATTENVVRWYRFDIGNLEGGAFTLQVELDLSVIPQFADKKAAARAAASLGLKTWRPVRLP